jgi:hypothetical protein
MDGGTPREPGASKGQFRKGAEKRDAKNKGFVMPARFRHRKGRVAGLRPVTRAKSFRGKREAGFPRAESPLPFCGQIRL